MTVGIYFALLVNNFFYTHQLINSFIKFKDLQYSKNINKQIYLFFIDSSDIGNYRGLLVLGIRELQNDELIKYCPDRKPNIPPYFTPLINPIINDFYFLVYTSGCYYIDKSTGKWSSFGMKVINDTSLLYTHCQSNHLTTFAGGLDEFLPTQINFIYIYSNSPFQQNKTIYLTVIVFFVIYILFSICGRWGDKQDMLKIGVTPLIDNNPIDDYFYELIVFTGNRLNSGTNSKV